MKAHENRDVTENTPIYVYIVIGIFLLTDKIENLMESQFFLPFAK